jgi:hypothetical protein
MSFRPYRPALVGRGCGYDIVVVTVVSKPSFVLAGTVEDSGRLNDSLL